MKEAALSIVIATRNRASLLTRALESLTAQEAAPPFEVVVADNGSSDATADVVARAADWQLDVRRVYVAEPNRAAARNAALATAEGEIVVFIDDDVWLPPTFLHAHAKAHRGDGVLAVSGPILNVTSYDERPRPGPFNYSNAFFCTCNVSLPRAALLAVSGFDSRFNLYGWEDTELGLRLRRSGVRRAFAWDAYLYHIKPRDVETAVEVERKTIERAQMAVLLLEKDATARTRFATGAYALNMWRSRIFAPPGLAPAFRRLAENARLPAFVRAVARAQWLDAVYVGALRRALAANEA